MPLNDAYRSLYERSADCMLLLEDDKFIDCNPAAVALFGASNKSEILLVYPSQMSPPIQFDGKDSYEKANEMIAQAFAEGSNRFEWDHMRFDGEVFRAEVLLTPLDVPGRNLIHSTVRDISERKQLEAELRQAQKMEAVGKLAGGIAHDFNNLLVVMLGSCDLLERQELSSPSARYVRQVREAGERAAGLIRQLLTFSRKQEVREEQLDLGVVVNNLMGMLERLVSERIELRVTASTPAPILANRHRTEQVLLNLVSNAQDAMPEGGRITVEVSSGRSDKLGECVVLRVADTGSGMSEETRQRAFEPFYTTKPMGNGTGLGLATVYNIVEQLGGELAINSSVGVGTTVTVRFPLAEIGVPTEEAIEIEADVGGGETILVVEDDPAIRQMTEILLETAGFRVLTALDGEDGLIVAASNAGKFDLIMTDVVMPRLGGPEMILRLREEGCDVPVVFMSGYTDATLHKVEPLGEEFDLIEKPFNLRTLASRIRAALDRKDQ